MPRMHFSDRTGRQKGLNKSVNGAIHSDQIFDRFPNAELIAAGEGSGEAGEPARESARVRRGAVSKGRRRRRAGVRPLLPGADRAHGL